MPHALYVCLQDDDKIATFVIDAETGQLTPQNEVPAGGGPSVMASSPDRRTLYVGNRTRPAISSFRIDRSTGRLALLGSVSQEHAPTFLAPDRTGRYLLCAYYQGGSSSSRRRRCGGYAIPGLAGDGHRRPRHSDRPLQSIRLCRISPGSTTTSSNLQRRTRVPT
jgi:6-phosphogluconolactonase (cycloisomerase 2 family)